MGCGASRHGVHALIPTSVVPEEAEEARFGTHFNACHDQQSVKNKPVLLVIDVQPKFIDDKGDCHPGA